MSKNKTKEELSQHKNEAISSLSDYLESLINSKDLKLNGKADKLSYWITDWTNFLKFEPQFSPHSLRRYKRGEIIKVHLGFNIGSEEGGLHYAVVIDKNNAKSSPVLTIVPLTSVKSSTDINSLKNGSVFLGNELFTSLNAKVSATYKHLTEEISFLEDVISDPNFKEMSPEFDDCKRRVKNCEIELSFLQRMRTEVLKMKMGSIALVNQITTISKMRIYDPKTDHDVLSGIKLSNEKLDLIDSEICKKHTNL